MKTTALVVAPGPMSDNGKTATMTAVTERVPLHERVPVEEITAQARDVKFSRVLLGLIGGLLWLIGWSAAKLCGVLWLAAAWCGVAVRTGWRQAKGVPLNQPSLERVLAENAELRAALARVS